MRSRFAETEIQPQLDLAPDLPNVTADLGHLEQALMGLLTNAVEATGHGGAVAVRTRYFTARCRREGDSYFRRRQRRGYSRQRIFPASSSRFSPRNRMARALACRWRKNSSRSTAARSRSAKARASARRWKSRSPPPAIYETALLLRRRLARCERTLRPRPLSVFTTPGSRLAEPRRVLP